MMQTIYALATAPGKAGISVVRVSGPCAFAAGRALAGDLPEPRRAAVRRLRSSSGEVLDEALVLCFRDGQSFTGEDVVEFHLHGSIAVISAVMGELSRQTDLRMAEPGEFTRRALRNGRLDLTQVEGLADLIDAETETQRRQALRILSGEVGRVVDGWRSRLIRALALIEVTIDFSDEDVPDDVSSEVLGLLSEVSEGLSQELDNMGSAERIRTGFEVAIIGAPNVGKSTLLNALAGREAAITSEFAGTTRDVIEVRMDIGGLAVTLLDTAGLRETSDPVEAIGVRIARERAHAADLRVYLVAGDDTVATQSPEDIVARAKIDLQPGPGFGVSGLTNEGVDDLIQRISSVLAARSASASLVGRERHRIALRDAVESLGMSSALVVDGPDFYDIAAAELRAGIRSLDILIGRVVLDDILDDIFSSFCLGK